MTTIDFDFLFRDTPANLKKVKAIADSLGATLARPFLPSSEMVRIERKEEFLQLDFVCRIHGLRSFEGVRRRASRIDFDGYTLLVADLRDIIKSKRAADRPRDRAVLLVLEETLNEKEKPKKKGSS